MKRPPRSLIAVAMFLVLGAFVIFSVGCDNCRPSQSNFAFIGFWNFPSAQTYTLQNPAPIPQTVNFIARVYYPSYDESVLEDFENPDLEGIDVAPGLHPLIVFGHGQFSAGVPTNYLGMSNLMNHLASWGYICVSVNLDVVHGNWASNSYGIPHRGELLLHAVDRMLALNNNASSLFHQTIDTSKIALIGHSRGGGGAIWAANDNHTQTSPRSIQAVATISPVDFGTAALQAPLPHISIYGSWDGDLSSGQGHRIWDAGVRTAHREFVEVYGANHFHFTDSAVYSSETNGISRENHNEIAQGFINAYFDSHVKGVSSYDWPLYLTGEVDMRAGVEEFLQYLDDSFDTIDNGSPLGTATTNNLSGTNDGSTLSLLQDSLLDDVSQHFYNRSDGLLVHWDASGDQLVFNFPVQNASSHDHLHFRAAQRPGNTLNVLDTRKSFKVRVSDAEGGAAEVSIRDYGDGLQYPDLSGSLAATSPYQYKAIPRSFRIPFADFAGVNFGKLTQVVFLFNEANSQGYTNTTGAIAVDDLEFSD